MRRSIVRAAFDAKRYRLFNPYNRILGQEPDLWRRMVQARALGSQEPDLHLGTAASPLVHVDSTPSLIHSFTPETPTNG